MFLDLDKHDQYKIAIKDDGGSVLTYGDICSIIEDFKRLNIPRSVVFCICDNCAGSLVGYIALENNGQVPLLLSVELDRALRNNLDRIYKPSYYWLPECISEEISGEVIYRRYGYALVSTGKKVYSINRDLSLLLTTSGSTGSQKLVRHKYGNLESSALNVAKSFRLNNNEIGICDLPMNYTMGLNVINSHILVGASVLMMKSNLMDRNFWSFIDENRGTNFTGVPFSYEILRRIGFEKMYLPNLHTLYEGGGKLSDNMFKWVASICKRTNKRFVATYGTTETSARIAYLEYADTTDRIGSIGKSINGGEIYLDGGSSDEQGLITGELVYRGPNVTMGYANNIQDLMKGDEFCGVFKTGDIAKRDKDGFYYIAGRKCRFVKLFGLRVSLDETEQLLKEKYQHTDFACVGNDKRMTIVTTDHTIVDDIVKYISEKTSIHNSAFRVYVVDTMPRNNYGKIDYMKLEKLVDD